MPPILYDLHAHPEPGTPDLSRPTASAVHGRIVCGTSRDDWDAVAAVARSWPGTVPAFGIHPWYADVPAENREWLDDLRERLTLFPNAWLGEAGLDGLRKNIPSLDHQEKVLTRQLELASELDRPVNLHCVRAWDELVTALDNAYLTNGPRPFILHSFAGPYQLIDELKERGAYFTHGPLQSRRDNRKARERARLIPEDRVLLESDAFLRPGVDDEAALTDTLTWLAAVRDIPEERLAERVADNSRRLVS